MARKNDWATVENAKVFGTNVLCFELVLNKKERFFVFGCYFLPSDKKGKAQRLVEQALRDKPVGSMPLVIGDLNATWTLLGADRRRFWRRTWGGTAWGARRATSKCAAAATCGGGGPTGG